jgi:hypothetical protein
MRPGLLLVAVAVLCAALGPANAQTSDERKGEDPKGTQANVLKEVVGALKDGKSCGGFLSDNNCAIATPAARRRRLRIPLHILKKPVSHRFQPTHRALQVTAAPTSETALDGGRKGDDGDEEVPLAFLDEFGGLAGARACLKKELGKALEDTKAGEKCASELNTVHEDNFPAAQPTTPELSAVEIDQLFVAALNASTAANSGTGTNPDGNGTTSPNPTGTGTTDPDPNTTNPDTTGPIGGDNENLPPPNGPTTGNAGFSDAMLLGGVAAVTVAGAVIYVSAGRRRQMQARVPRGMSYVVPSSSASPSRMQSYDANGNPPGYFM